jgi:hypothetical protein
MDVIAEHPHPFEHGGQRYTVRILGVQRADGTWSGSLEFVPLAGGATRRTDAETSQPNRDALAYWASGLEDVYLEGAFGRSD